MGGEAGLAIAAAVVRGDLLDEDAIKALPKVPNIVFMAGRKFGSTGDAATTWAIDAGSHPSTNPFVMR